jgi:hypothetical protein
MKTYLRVTPEKFEDAQRVLHGLPKLKNFSVYHSTLAPYAVAADLLQGRRLPPEDDFNRIMMAARLMLANAAGSAPPVGASVMDKLIWVRRYARRVGAHDSLPPPPPSQLTDMYKTCEARTAPGAPSTFVVPAAAGAVAGALAMGGVGGALAGIGGLAGVLAGGTFGAATSAAFSALPAVQQLGAWRAAPALAGAVASAAFTACGAPPTVGWGAAGVTASLALAVPYGIAYLSE